SDFPRGASQAPDGIGWIRFAPVAQHNGDLMTEFEEKAIPHAMFIGGAVFFSILNPWLLAVPAAFYTSRGLQKFVPKYLESRRAKKERDAQTAPVRAELRRQIEQEREAIIEEAKRRMEQRIQIAHLISDPLIREQEIASANRE